MGCAGRSIRSPGHVLPVDLVGAAPVLVAMVAGTVGAVMAERKPGGGA